MHVMEFVGHQRAFNNNPTDQEPGIEELRLALMFGKISVILMFMGIIITWLEWNIVFWESITGPFLLLMSFLMLIVSVKQFLIAKKRKEETICPAHENCVEDGSNNVENIRCNNDSNWQSTSLVELPSYEEALQSVYCPLSRIEPPYNSSPPSYEQVVSMNPTYDQLRVVAATSSDVTIELPEHQSEKPQAEPT